MMKFTWVLFPLMIPIHSVFSAPQSKAREKIEVLSVQVADDATLRLVVKKSYSAPPLVEGAQLKMALSIGDGKRNVTPIQSKKAANAGDAQLKADLKKNEALAPAALPASQQDLYLTGIPKDQLFILAQNLEEYFSRTVQGPDHPASLYYEASALSKYTPKDDPEFHAKISRIFFQDGTLQRNELRSIPATALRLSQNSSETLFDSLPKNPNPVCEVSDIKTGLLLGTFKEDEQGGISLSKNDPTQKESQVQAISSEERLKYASQPSTQDFKKTGTLCARVVRGRLAENFLAPPIAPPVNAPEAPVIASKKERLRVKRVVKQQQRKRRRASLNPEKLPPSPSQVRGNETFEGAAGAGASQ